MRSVTGTGRRLYLSMFDVLVERHKQHCKTSLHWTLIFCSSTKLDLTSSFSKACKTLGTSCWLWALKPSLMKELRYGKKKEASTTVSLLFIKDIVRWKAMIMSEFKLPMLTPLQSSGAFLSTCKIEFK